MLDTLSMFDDSVYGNPAEGEAILAAQSTGEQVYGEDRQVPDLLSLDFSDKIDLAEPGLDIPDATFSLTEQDFMGCSFEQNFSSSMVTDIREDSVFTSDLTDLDKQESCVASRPSVADSWHGDSGPLTCTSLQSAAQTPSTGGTLHTQHDIVFNFDPPSPEASIVTGDDVFDSLIDATSPNSLR